MIRRRVPRQDQKGEAFKRGCRKAVVGLRAVICDAVTSFRGAQKLMTWSLCGCFSVSLSLLHPTYDALLFSSETFVSISSGETRRIADMAGDHHNETEPLQLQTTAKRAKA